MKQFIWSVALVFLLFLGRSVLVHAQQCPATDYDCQIKEIQREIDALAPAHEKNKKN